MMAEAAARGRLALQRCAACGAAQYPPREVCRVCLSDDLAWTESDDAPATLLAACEVHHSVDGPIPPRRIALVGLPGGAAAVCFLAADPPTRVTASLDAEGRPVLTAS